MRPPDWLSRRSHADVVIHMRLRRHESCEVWGRDAAEVSMSQRSTNGQTKHFTQNTFKSRILSEIDM